MPSSTPINFFIFLFFCFYSSAGIAASDDDFAIYPVQSHSAEELKKAADGIAGGARISVMNNKVIVAGTKAQRAAVLKLFGELDHKLQNYIVSVRAASKESASRDAIAISNRSATVESTSQQDARNAVQSVTLMDGGNASIGSDSPFAASVVVHLRSMGKNGAHVEIRQKNENSNGEQALLTELDLPQGEWRTVGGITNQKSGESGRLLGKARSASQAARDIQIRVDLEKNGDGGQ